MLGLSYVSTTKKENESDERKESCASDTCSSVVDDNNGREARMFDFKGDLVNELQDDCLELVTFQLHMCTTVDS